MRQTKYTNLVAIILIISFIFTGCTTSTVSSTEAEKIVGIAWREDVDSEFYTNMYTAVKEAGGTPILLGMVISNDLQYTDGKVGKNCVDDNDFLSIEASNKLKAAGYENSNVEEVMKGISAVIFTGGEDISPTLYATPCDWHGIESERDYNATRDVSDYILMQYCIDKDIQVLGVCRGMQMIATVSGAEMIQDIPTYYESIGKEYNYEHRNEKHNASDYRDYTPHLVEVDTNNTLLYNIVGRSEIVGCPSWHHQMIKDTSTEGIKISGITHINGVDVIEAIERTDKKYIIGIQFHPEAAIVKHLNNVENKDLFMEYDDAMLIFRDFIERIPAK